WLDHRSGRHDANDDTDAGEAGNRGEGVRAAARRTGRVARRLIAPLCRDRKVSRAFIAAVCKRRSIGRAALTDKAKRGLSRQYSMLSLALAPLIPRRVHNRTQRAATSSRPRRYAGFAPTGPIAYACRNLGRSKPLCRSFNASFIEAPVGQHRKTKTF